MHDPTPTPPTVPLPPDQLEQVLMEDLPGWRLSPDGGSLVWSYTFSTDTASNTFLLWVFTRRRRRASARTWSAGRAW